MKTRTLLSLVAAFAAGSLAAAEPGFDMRAASSAGPQYAVFAPGDEVLPQIANGTVPGGQVYLTQFEAMNITNDFARVEIFFYDSQGRQMSIPVLNGGQTFSTNSLASTVQGRGFVRAETAPANAAVQVGYAIVRSTPPGAVIVTARFSNRVPGERLFSAAIPLETSQHNRFQFNYTNTNNVVSSLAVVSANAQNVVFTARDTNGQAVCSAQRGFAAGQHLPFILTDVLGCTVNSVGVVDVQGETTGLSGVGFLANDAGRGAFVTSTVYGARVP